jgi:hypothetical protein
MRWIIWLVIILHGVWGIIGLSSNTQLFTTTFYALLQLTGFSQSYTSLILLGGSVLATVSLLRFQKKRREVGLFLVLPQQFLLLISMGGVIEAVLLGTYANGVIEPRVFIFADQVPILLLGCFHSLAIFDSFSKKVAEVLGRIA